MSDSIAESSFSLRFVLCTAVKRLSNFHFMEMSQWRYHSTIVRDPLAADLIRQLSYLQFYYISIFATGRIVMTYNCKILFQYIDFFTRG
jgi:hypothetical protein